MAAIEIEDTAVRVRFSLTEKIFALRREDLTFPLDAIESIEIVDDGLHATRGIRAPGLGIPGSRRVGTWRHRGGKDLVSVRRHQQALRIDLRDQPFAAVIMGDDDAASTRELLDRLR